MSRWRTRAPKVSNPLQRHVALWHHAPSSFLAVEVTTEQTTQSGSADSASRPAVAAQSTGLYRARVGDPIPRQGGSHHGKEGQRQRAELGDADERFLLASQ
jgi:hypothetical protein